MNLNHVTVIVMIWMNIQPTINTGNYHPPDIHRQNLLYEQDITESPYKPIRIHTVYKDLYYELSVSNQHKLKTVVRSAMNKISQLLYVFPVKQVMLLKRSGCHKGCNSDGPNKGKCCSAKKYYQSEICMDTFIIPEDHLDGLYIWNETYPEPLEVVFPPGSGINKTDFVLYVESLTTDICGFSSSESVLAYSRVCQVDQHDRPIAGYINLCPSEVITSSPEKLYKAMVHELFHTLGFSKEHFDYFKKCLIINGTLVCHPLNLVKISEVSGLYRMVTPAVKREAQIHFGCYNETKFGAPVDSKNGYYTSHWDSRLMFGSIMSPKILNANLTFIDRITLAVFEDSGWYKVDYTYADMYHWGKNIGCSSWSDFCLQHKEYSCRNGSRGCHYLHKHKGWCQVNNHSNCGIYLTKSGSNCMTTSEIIYVEEIYGETSACFVSNLTKDLNRSLTTDGRCYLYKCTSNQNLQIKVKYTEWIDCPFGQWIKILGYNGYIKCPTYQDIMCPKSLPITTETIEITTSIDQSTYYTTDSAGTQTHDNSDQQSSSGSHYCSLTIMLLFIIFMSIIK